MSKIEGASQKNCHRFAVSYYYFCIMLLILIVRSQNINSMAKFKVSLIQNYSWLISFLYAIILLSFCLDIPIFLHIFTFTQTHIHYFV